MESTDSRSIIDPLDIIKEARNKLNNMDSLDINDWIQALAILGKIEESIKGKRSTHNSSVELWW